MVGWSFLTRHGRVLLCIAHDPGVRLRDIAATVGITERSAYRIVSDLAAAGYAVKQKDGRRNHYQIEAQLPSREPASQQLAIGEVLALLAGASAGNSRPEENKLTLTSLNDEGGPRRTVRPRRGGRPEQARERSRNASARRAPGNHSVPRLLQQAPGEASGGAARNEGAT
jgi:predicted DNA-binding transcriptional regulator YafY